MTNEELSAAMKASGLTFDHVEGLVKVTVDRLFVNVLKGYNSDQPRVSAGSAHGGEWTSGGGDTSEGPRSLETIRQANARDARTAQHMAQNLSRMSRWAGGIEGESFVWRRIMVDGPQQGANRILELATCAYQLGLNRANGREGPNDPSPGYPSWCAGLLTDGSFQANNFNNNVSTIADTIRTQQATGNPFDPLTFTRQIAAQWTTLNGGPRDQYTNSPGGTSIGTLLNRLLSTPIPH